ncbi:MAG: PHP domain-containing protein [Coriobacteriia bacterium]|nr:PHP domain-containing protein [Coriobacteriia bacterium]MCL2606871.1 PHP domain-containing protein [Coriobacteriia bacterium]
MMNLQKNCVDNNKAIKADLHVHTVGSGHGFSTVSENAEAALEKGMELIAITDHGPSIPQGAHNWYFWNLSHVPGIYKGLVILRGCEANLIPDSSKYESRWGIDVADIVAQRLDYVTFGFHPTVGFDDKDSDRNTDAAIHAMQSPYVDQFNHPGNLAEFPFDVDAVIAAAVENDVVIELNNSSQNPLGARAATGAAEIDFARKAYSAGAKLAINSDAHHATGIGVIEPALSRAADAGIPIDAYINIDSNRALEHIQGRRERPLLAAALAQTQKEI